MSEKVALQLHHNVDCSVAPTQIRVTLLMNQKQTNKVASTVKPLMVDDVSFFVIASL
jgi:hypothetical protein